ncbi:response regulator [Aquincola tertiaricarbonis]|uniref:Response regulator n=1 Tax=Aquincola tertiaricarbonis TaxID=391953 RepID=A0ABY4SAR6_AQUTE|nr:response regulator [Aquincola tertiaricarbonis]URI08997.1 response regulator [Aquincola tertiaricarbonis]
MNPQYDLLIVDDDPTQIVVLGAMLRPFGQVRFAKRGADALRLARQSIPDLMLLDLQLPDLDGVAVLAQMRRSPLLADVPVVVLTGTDPVAAGRSVSGLGVAACLPKPPDGPALAACVQAQLQLALRRLAQHRPRGSGEQVSAFNRRSFDLLLALACQNLPHDGPLALLRLAPAAASPACCDAALLERLAQAVRSAARRPGDCIGHLGSEGLALLLPDTDEHGAACVTHQLLQGPGGAAELAAGFVVLTADAAGSGAVLPSMLMGAAEAAWQAARAAGPGQARQVVWHPGVGAGRPLPVPGPGVPPGDAV